MSDDGDNDFGLVTPFLTDDPVFAYGCEFGILFERLKHETEIDDAFHTENQDRILVMADRCGWVVEVVTPLDWEDGWFKVKMHKRRQQESLITDDEQWEASVGLAVLALTGVVGVIAAFVWATGVHMRWW